MTARAAATADLDDIVALERILAHGWQGTTERRLGDWLLRAGGGFTGRANSVLPLGDPGTPDAWSAVRDFYAAHRLPVVAQLPESVDGRRRLPLSARLDRLGWDSSAPTLVMTAPLDRLPAVRGSWAVELLAAPTADWLDGYRYRGAALPAAASAVLVSGDRPVFVLLRDPRSGDRVGVARGVVHDGWLGVTAVTVEPDRRRSGIGLELMAVLAGVGRSRAAGQVYLQVDAANEPAITLYGRLGFAVHHRYVYRRPIVAHAQ